MFFLYFFKSQAKPPEAIVNGHIGGEQDPELEPVLDMKTIIVRGNQRPTSMYETREGLRKPSTWNANTSQVRNSEC